MVEGASAAALAIGRNVGGNFDAGPVTAGAQVGTTKLSFSDCNTGSLIYTFSDGSARSGTLPLKRLARNVGCSASGTVAESDADYGLSGNWYEPSTSGQGLIIEINEASSMAFITWYTYAPNGAAASGDTSQRWYAVQGAYSTGTNAGLSGRLDLERLAATPAVCAV